MAIEQDMKNFVAEFEALKAKYEPEFAGAKIVLFTDESGKQDFRECVPYSCRKNDAGDIVCVKERPI